MTDDDLRAALRASHAGDAPPPFAPTVAAARRRRPYRRLVAPALALATAAMIATLVIVLRHRAPARQPELALDGIGMRTTSLQLPLDSLLDVPGQDLLATTPDLTGGTLP
jgi:hypothetical protein